ncbi:cell division protein FtsA [Notoacmeibacter sp. MSK16QG-6]|uniref:cell division protein FtsA n=1 Tax=Notoacmeibacter sp. MSK16QG-6 TaxID=2957982 RepID=UPI00209CE6BA|nr:cell division protein FtsA [Notoacmeibacter sp. MSK16QG-6]MCP1199697.1 cell division protein FtsA [Notoacmeibacter sp. MSK16QG-6]
MTILPFPRQRSTRGGVLTVLDIGSTKLTCIIARLKPRDGDGEVLKGRTHQMRVIGIGHCRSNGVKGGIIVDLDAAERSIRKVVESAEHMAGLTVDSIIVNLAAGRLKSESFVAHVDLAGHEVETGDVSRVLSAGAKLAEEAERTVLHSLPTGFSLDEESGITDPRGMVADRLGVTMHVLTGDAGPLRNLELAINRCHLSVERIVATPYASGLSTLVDDEVSMGAACIDLGGGTTTLSVFQNGRFIHADAVAVGGHHVTLDLARGMSTSIEEAERLKVMHGSALPSAADDRELVTVPGLSSDDSTTIPRSVVTKIIRARTEETLELIRDRLNASGHAGIVGKRLVLTGGGSQLNGMPEVARRILGRNVRIGRPLGVSGLPEMGKGPAFATAVGLLIYPQVARFETRQRGGTAGFATQAGGRFARVGAWLRESF